ncbi:Flp family type IVb pilin [Lonepinella sp. MS14436]|uniref:Flp family type IVb pilin n=1 Tax=Lonepinella sp. MS14436 TaxID=3003619 RepID=UPI0036D7D394
MLSKLTNEFYLVVAEKLYKFKRDQVGVTATEYALMAVVIAVFVVAVFYSDTGFVAELSSKYSSLTSTVTDAVITTQ